MSFAELTRALESDELYCKAAVANDVPSLLRIFSRDPAVRALRVFISQATENIDRVALYADGLFRQAGDGQFRFENDLAIAACIYVVSGTASYEVDRLMRNAERTALRSLEWVAAVARELNDGRPSSGAFSYVLPPVATHDLLLQTGDPVVVTGSSTSTWQPAGMAA